VHCDKNSEQFPLLINIPIIDLWSSSVFASHWLTISPSNQQTLVEKCAAAFQEHTQFYIEQQIKSEVEVKLLSNNNNEQLFDVNNRDVIKVQVHKSSTMSLLDYESVLRVNGRLEAYQDMSFQQKHPALTSHSNFTSVISVIIRVLREQDFHSESTSLSSINTIERQRWNHHRWKERSTLGALSATARHLRRDSLATSARQCVPDGN